MLIAALLPFAASAPSVAAASVSSTSTVVNQASGNCADDPDSSGKCIVPSGDSTANDTVLVQLSGGCDMNRSTRAQKISWNADGTPNLGVPVATGVQITAPSGEPAS